MCARYWPAVLLYWAAISTNVKIADMLNSLFIPVRAVSVAHFVVTHGVFHDIAFYALRSPLTSKKDNHSFGNAMIAMMEWLFPESIKIFMEK